MGAGPHHRRRKRPGADLPRPPLPRLRPRGLARRRRRARVPRPQGHRGRRRHQLRRLRLEARRPHRNEEARRGALEALPPGLRLLDAPRPRPPALRRPLQLRRVPGLRLRDADGLARRHREARQPRRALRPAGFPLPRPAQARLRQRPRRRHPRSRRLPRRRASASSASAAWTAHRPALHPANARRPLRRGHRPAPEILRHPAPRRLHIARRQLRPARRPLRGDEHQGRATGGRFKGVAYFNGGLFAEPARLELHDRRARRPAQGRHASTGRRCSRKSSAPSSSMLERHGRHAR